MQEESVDTMTRPLTSQILMEAEKLSCSFSIISYIILLSITGYLLAGRPGPLFIALFFIYYNKSWKIRNIYVKVCAFKQKTE